MFRVWLRKTDDEQGPALPAGRQKDTYEAAVQRILDQAHEDDQDLPAWDGPTWGGPVDGHAV